MTDTAQLRRTFEGIFARPAAHVARAPGRVNLIGEHTDYNDGFVFPAAIGYDVALAVRPRTDRLVRAYSVKFRQMSEFQIDGLERSADARWTNYIRGVIHILGIWGHPTVGIDVVVDGDVPAGSGLSSSAAFEVAACLAMETATSTPIEPVQRALLCQRAEREFVGVQCGIMDQFISALGQTEHALFIDTRSLEYRAVPLPRRGVSIVIANSHKPRGLVDSEYNTRRAECEEAVRILASNLPEIRALRDVASGDLRKYGSGLPPTVLRRARHVVTENERVVSAISALNAGNTREFGALMNASHDSLRDDYQVSCRELDLLVETARSVPGVYGSRMTGAGFGGCTVSLVSDDSTARFKREVGRVYKDAVGRQPSFYICTAVQGASLA